MKILFTNDDGIDAPGLRALLTALPKGHEAVVVAPASEKSASGHSLTLGEKIRVEKRQTTDIPEYAVHGTPADCVKIAISEIDNFYPDLVVSGINQGSNTGVSVYYSGTISAAREGLINRIPAIAISLCSKKFTDFSAAVDIARDLIEGFCADALPPNVLLNVNVPGVPKRDIKGVKVTKQADSHFIEEFILEKDHGHSRVFTLVGEIELHAPDGLSDEEAVNEKFISVTPLKLDLTEYAAFSALEKWFAKNEE